MNALVSGDVMVGFEGCEEAATAAVAADALVAAPSPQSAALRKALEQLEADEDW